MPGPQVLINGIHALQSKAFVGPPDMLHLIKEKAVVLGVTVLLFGLYWFFAYALATKWGLYALGAAPEPAEGPAMSPPTAPGLWKRFVRLRFVRVMVRWILFTSLYSLLLVALIVGIFLWIVFYAGPTLIEGSSEPLLPIFAVVAESVLEGLKAVLDPIETLARTWASCLGDRTARTFATIHKVLKDYAGPRK
jgi:hypothetical protein